MKVRIQIALFLIVLGVLCVLQSQPVLAVTASSSGKVVPTPTPTPSPAPSPSPEDTTTNLKKRIERVVQEKSDEVKLAVAELSFKKRGFIGTVERLSEETITIKTLTDTRIISLTPEVSLLRGNQPVKVSDITVGSWVIVLGLEKEDGTLAAKRILVSNTSLAQRDYEVNVGTLVKIEKSKITFQPRNSKDTQTLSLVKATSVQDMQGSSMAATKLEEQLQALVISYHTTDDKNVASTIRLLSQPRPSASTTPKP